MSESTLEPEEVLMPGTPAPVDRHRLEELLALEEARFSHEHPRSRELFARAAQTLLDGVPMNWMVRWASPFPVFAETANGAHLTDVDGHRYLDLCLGDTGVMTGHVPPAIARTVIEQTRRGLSFMLPTEDAIWVGEELARRFGLPFWQFALTASDANRFCIRLARQITKRPFVLVFNGCYHGTVDEAFIAIDEGKARCRRGNIGPPIDPLVTTRVVEFNDLASLESVLHRRDVACVLAEPALTNCGIVLPAAGYHEALRKITCRTGTLLVIDEAHTLCAGTGGCTREYALQPDMLTLGKPIGGGIPAAAFGLSAAVAERIRACAPEMDPDCGGIGGTLAGSALSLAATRATLRDVLNESFYRRTVPLARRFATGVRSVIRANRLPWHVVQLGCRVEYRFRATPPRNGGEALAAVDTQLDRYFHLALMNRGVLLTPFHNMALLSPEVTEADVDCHTKAYSDCVRALLNWR